MATRAASRDTRLAWVLMAPAIGLVGVIAAGPLLVTVWESLHRHDLRLPWLGRPWIGAGNYTEALSDPRFLAALGHTAAFTLASVTLELLLGLTLALALDAMTRGRALARVVALLPWALPTVVAALVWRFMFEGDVGVVNRLAGAAGLAGLQRDWLADPLAAWVPIVLADVWKTTPFVALLLLAGLQTIDASLYEAARLDGAGVWARFTRITLPLLRPAIAVALVFRALDAFRIFDLVFVLTGGGPGTATEVVSQYAFTSLLQDLRFGFGSAIAMLVFAVSFGCALVYVRLLGPSIREAR